MDNKKTTRLSLKRTLSLILLLVCCAGVCVSCGKSIDLTQYPTPVFAPVQLPDSSTKKVSISLIETGFAKAPEMFVFQGGRVFKSRKLSHVSLLVQHESGTFVFDTGLGKEIEAQFHEHFSWLDRQLFKFTKVQSLKETLESHGFDPAQIDFILPTHLHFDHASGIEDFEGTPVRITREEYDHATSDAAAIPAFIPEQYDAESLQWEFLTFVPQPYEVFSESLDLFGDGTVVLVKLPGHTDGSIGMFVNLASGKRYFFTGDLTWAREAFDKPSAKNRIASKKVDLDREGIKATLVQVHHLIQKKPEIHIVPAHDTNAQLEIAHFPEVEY